MYTYDSEKSNLFLGEVSATTNVIIRDASGKRKIKCKTDYDGPEICIRQLINLIKNESTPKHNGKGGYDALKLTMASLESIETGRTIYLNQ